MNFFRPLFCILWGAGEWKILIPQNPYPAHPETSPKSTTGEASPSPSFPPRGREEVDRRVSVAPSQFSAYMRIYMHTCIYIHPLIIHMNLSHALAVPLSPSLVVFSVCSAGGLHPHFSLLSAQRVCLSFLKGKENEFSVQSTGNCNCNGAMRTHNSTRCRTAYEPHSPRGRSGVSLHKEHSGSP